MSVKIRSSVLCCCVVWYNVPSFWKNIILPSSELKSADKAGGLSKNLTTVCQTSQRNILLRGLFRVWFVRSLL